MVKISVGGIVKTSIVTAFTIATALIWKDVITDMIELIVPPGEELLYKFVAAVIATIIVVIAIYVLLETESKAEGVVKRLRHKK